MNQTKTKTKIRLTRKHFTVLASMCPPHRIIKWMDFLAQTHQNFDKTRFTKAVLEKSVNLVPIPTLKDKDNLLIQEVLKELS